jgi:hypothetical protein
VWSVYEEEDVDATLNPLGGVCAEAIGGACHREVEVREPLPVSEQLLVRFVRIYHDQLPVGGCSGQDSRVPVGLRFPQLVEPGVRDDVAVAGVGGTGTDGAPVSVPT